ncbi:MAG: FtsW/RodA/SpoVE family cell cycle protein [Lachnospiraceae bacterium]
MDRHNYIEILSEQIRCKKALPLVTKELEAHIDDQKEAFLAEGMTEREAEEEAVREMGDPVSVGVDMDRIYRPKMDWRMIFLIGIVSLAGLALQYYMTVSITNVSLPFLRNPGQNLVYVIAGFLIMMGVCYVDYTRIAYRAKELLLFYYILLILSMMSGTTINGTNYAGIWILGIHFDVRMSIFLFIPLYCAVVYSYQGQGYQGLLKMFFIALPQIMICGIRGVYIVIPVLAIVLSAAVYKRYFKVNVKKALTVIWGAAIFIPLICGVCILKFGAPYQVMRLKVMIDSEKYTMEEGYQFYVIRKFLEGSKLIGRSPNAMEISGNIPENPSLILTYITSYYGVLAAALVIVIILLVIARLAKLTVRQKNRLGSLIGIGCTAVIAVHIIWYVLVNFGIVNAGYIYCPFITYGGTGIIFMDIMFGIMLSIYRYQNVSEAEVPKKMFQRKKCQG